MWRVNVASRWVSQQKIDLGKHKAKKSSEQRKDG